MARSKRRLDELLVDAGLVIDLRQARGLIMANRVVVDGQVITKPGVSVALDAKVHLREGPKEFVSRGGYKLKKALDVFGLDVGGKQALDAGACTGGFTDCLLKRGAAKVYAVDVGFGQIHSSLVHDPRVVVLERTNVGDLRPETFSAPPTFACADLSYLSLTSAIPLLEPLLHPSAELVCLVKPLYEGLQQDDVRSRSALAVTLAALLRAIQPLAERSIRGFASSPIHGGRGAVEFLLWMSPASGMSSFDEAIETALDEAAPLLTATVASDDEG